MSQTATEKAAPLPFDVFSVFCPSHSTLRDVTGRWAPLVLIALDEGLTRFGELHRRIEGSSERMLSQTLRVLQEDAFVDRELDDTGRPSYTLTDGGRAVAENLRSLRTAIYSHLGTRASA